MSHRLFVPLLAVILSPLAGLPALAQTELHLSATGTVQVPPDESVADLTVQVYAAQAAAAQASVNRSMAAALNAARHVPGIIATTGNYGVTSREAQGHVTQYAASQTLRLIGPAEEGRPGAAFTDLIARMQSQGLQVNTLSAGLSPSGRQHAQDEAIQTALRRLHDQTTLIATSLGEKTGPIKTLTVGASGPILPFPGRMMAMAAPSDQPGPVTVTESVSATINLTP